MVLHVLLSDMHVSMYVWQSRVGDAKWGVAQGTKWETVENSTKGTETPWRTHRTGSTELCHACTSQCTPAGALESHWEPAGEAVGCWEVCLAWMGWPRSPVHSMSQLTMSYCCMSCVYMGAGWAASLHTWERHWSRKCDLEAQNPAQLENGT